MRLTKPILAVICACFVIIGVSFYIAGHESNAPENGTEDTENQTGGGGGTQNQEELHEYGEVEGQIGELFVFEDSEFRIVSVVEESRCPSDVTCIQAGTLTMAVEGSDGSTRTIRIGEAIEAFGLVISLIDVTPYPISTAHIPQSAYRFTLRVEAASKPVLEVPDIELPVQSNTNGACYVGGCSSQLCTDSPDMVSTCEYKEEYACYQNAVCERQSSGECGWTQTDELALCIAGANTFQ